MIKINQNPVGAAPMCAPLTFHFFLYRIISLVLWRIKKKLGQTHRSAPTGHRNYSSEVQNRGAKK